MLFGLVSLTFTTGVWFWNQREAAQIHVMMREARKERNTYCNKLLTLKGSNLETLAFDYTYWDEMVKFVTKPNLRWAAENLDAVLATYQARGIWIFDTREKLIYSVNTTRDKRLKNLPLPQGAILTALGKSPFCHFYLQTKQGLLEVRGATIHATADASRVGRSYGYFLTARLWNAEYLQEISYLSGGDARILPAPETNQSSSGFSIRFEQPLSAWDGHPLVYLVITSEQTTLKMLAGVRRKTNILALAFLFSLMVVLSLCLFFWVHRPLRRIALALQGPDTGSLDRLVTSSSEFGHIARLICAFSQQKTRLEQEVIERQRAEEAHRWQADHDALTGLPNRAMFRRHLDEAHRRLREAGHPLALLFIDLDNFKLVNDSLGHEAGDHLLIEVAKRLQRCARQTDIAARLGGDEFTLLLEGLEEEKIAISIAERFLQSLQRPVHLGSTEFFPSGSIGVVYADTPSEHAGDLLRDADTAMYYAKLNGKADYRVFDPTMNHSQLERAELETALHRALEQKELRVYYQPVVNLTTGQLCGAEALVRWERPGKGMVAPGLFITIAEETGMIVPLGYWVMEEACRQICEWKHQFPHLSDLVLNVNLSGRQLQRDDFFEQVCEIIARTGIEPSCLKLELTESVLISDASSATAKMEKMRALGVRIAMDDFGTGYSSIASLHTFPLDTVKVDRSFVHRLADSPEASPTITAIVLIAKSLGINVTAEGIETVEQITLLQSLGCDAGQGFLFAPPLSPGNFAARFASKEDACFVFRNDSRRELIESYLQELPYQQEVA